MEETPHLEVFHFYCSKPTWENGHILILRKCCKSVESYLVLKPGADGGGCPGKIQRLGKGTRCAGKVRSGRVKLSIFELMYKDNTTAIEGVITIGRRTRTAADVWPEKEDAG